MQPERPTARAANCRPTQPSDTALRTLSVLEALCGFAATGASNADLTAATQLNPSAITRATASLITQGWCRKDEATGRFFPTARFARLAVRMADDFERAQRRMDDLRHALLGR